LRGRTLRVRIPHLNGALCCQGRSQEDRRGGLTSPALRVGDNDSFHAPDPIVKYRKNIANIPENYQINTEILPEKYRTYTALIPIFYRKNTEAKRCRRAYISGVIRMFPRVHSI